MTDSASAVVFASAFAPAESESSSTIGATIYDWVQALQRAVVCMPSSPRSLVRISEAKLAQLASERPQSLVALIETNALGPADLTFAAEIAGAMDDWPRVVPMLARLLQHASPVVREGAVYGLVRHADRVPAVRAIIRDAITGLLGTESSPGVRAAASDALDLLDDQP
jgi:hypothetical protein